MNTSTTNLTSNMTDAQFYRFQQEAADAEARAKSRRTRATVTAPNRCLKTPKLGWRGSWRKSPPTF